LSGILVKFLFILLHSREIDSTGAVAYIVDGDTFDVTSVGRICLVDINTPGGGEPGADEATNYIKKFTQLHHYIISRNPHEMLILTF